MARYKQPQQTNTLQWTVKQKQSGVRLFNHEQALNRFTYLADAYSYAIRELNPDRYQVFYRPPAPDKSPLTNFFF